MSITTVGYGDISPVQNVEYALVAVFMITGGLLWAWVIGSLTTIMSNANPHSTHFKKVTDSSNLKILIKL